MTIGVQQNEFYAQPFSTLAWHCDACLSFCPYNPAVPDISAGN
jgi:hypothetical protein